MVGNRKGNDDGGGNDLEDKPYILTVGEILNGKFRFHLPAFQRRYRWKVDNCRILLADIEQAMLDLAEMGKYSLGEIILFKVEASDGVRMMLINGQQRLITLTALFCVLRDMGGG